MFKKIKAIVLLKCPRCQEGNLFEGSAYNPKTIINMHAHCPKCNQPFFLEPGFYFGAMFVSYMLSVGIGLVVFTLLWATSGFDKKVYFMRSAFETTLVLVLLFPIVLRLSRSIWLSVFYKEKTTFYTDEEKKE